MVFIQKKAGMKGRNTYVFGAFNNYVDQIFTFFDPLPPCVDSFYILSMDKNRHFWPFSPSSCPRSCWMPPNMQLQWLYDLESDHINPRHKNIVGYGVFSSKLKEWPNLRNDFSILASHLYKFEQKYCSPACTI